MRTDSKSKRSLKYILKKIYLELDLFIPYHTKLTSSVIGKICFFFTSIKMIEVFPLPTLGIYIIYTQAIQQAVSDLYLDLFIDRLIKKCQRSS